MLINYLREDKAGNPVRVEIWKDDNTGSFVRIKRVTYAPSMTYRSDIYQVDNLNRFRAALTEEIMSLMVYLQALEEILKPVEEEKQEETPTYDDETMSRLCTAVNLLQR